MSENSFKSIRNGLIVTVVGGLILTSIPVLRGYSVSFLAWLWSGIVWTWEAIFASYSLPGWLWLLVFILAIIGVVNILIAMKSAYLEPEFKRYVEDTMHGAKWRWRWLGNQISNVSCYCPRCDATLIYDDSSCRAFNSSVRKTDFICERCGHVTIASIPGGNIDFAISAVEREIGRRVRTGEYKNR